MSFDSNQAKVHAPTECMDADSRTALSAKLIDPLNRFYRYPWVKKIAEYLLDKKITPNQITIIHTVIGVVAAIFVYREHYIAAVVFYELRNILDSLDGLLARMRKQVTPMGRALDALGSGISFNALMIAGAVRLTQDFRQYNPVMILSGVFIFALIMAHCGTVYQLMRRKLGSIIHCEIDSVERDWRELYQSIQAKKAGLLAWFGFWLDSAAIHFVSTEWHQKIRRRKNASDWEARLLRESALMNELACVTRKAEFRRTVRWTAFVSDDNVFAIICLSLLISSLFPEALFPNVHPVLVAFTAGLAYSILALGMGLMALHRFLHGVHRE